MKKTLAVMLSITSLILCACQASPKKPEGTSKEDREEETTRYVVEIADETEDVTEATETTEEEWVDPLGMGRPAPDQYIDPEIYTLSIYFADVNNHDHWAFSVGEFDTNGNGVSLQASSNDGKWIYVNIDEEHAQAIFDEISKYKFYYWTKEEYQNIDENGVITNSNPPYDINIYSPQFINRTQVRLNDEDLEAFLTYVDAYCESIYASQQGG